MARAALRPRTNPSESPIANSRSRRRVPQYSQTEGPPFLIASGPAISGEPLGISDHGALGNDVVRFLLVGRSPATGTATGRSASVAADRHAAGL